MPHLCGHPVVQQPPCFPASTGPLRRRRRRRRRRLAAAYRPLLINYDYTCGGTHICIHTAAPTQTCCGIAHIKHTHTLPYHRPLLRSKRGSRRGEVSGASTDWLLGCPWRQHMGAERAGGMMMVMPSVFSQRPSVLRKLRCV